MESEHSNEASRVGKEPARGPSTGGSLESQLRAAMARAEAAEKEFQAFAYTISHDLRAPLRAIEGFSKILAEDFSKDLPPEVKGFLGHIIANARVLSSQIEDLLLFYRVGKTPPVKTPINPRELIEEAWRDVEKNARSVRLDLGPMPSTITADPKLISQVFKQLLSNGVKFTIRSEAPQIEIGACEADGKFEFFVSDNGVGFEQQYATRLFEVFQKLHPQGEFPGNGIGLAVVRRVVEAHHGSVRAEGKSGEGATFRFTLPK
jgi:signal transduction histidine kinase